MFFVFLIYLYGVEAYLGSVHQYNRFEPSDIFFIESPSKTTISSFPQPEKYKKMTCSNLAIDQSCIIVNSNVNYTVKFKYQNMECDNCTMLELKHPLKPYQSQKVILDFASLGTTWQVVDEKDKTVCTLTEKYLGENSWYHVNVTDTGCTLVCDKEPDAIFYPLLIALGVYLLLIVFWFLGSLLYRSTFLNNIFQRNSLDDLAAAFSSSSSIEEKKQKPPQQRLRSLDTVRGIAIALMIFVNYGGGKYSFLHHAHWNGLMVADVVFPWFIWMMGMSMALSLKSQLRKVVSRKKIFFKIVKRSMILFALGLMLNTLCTNVNLNNIRIFGVLQRFGISYFVVSTIHLFYASADDEANPSSPFRDITAYGGEWLIMFAFLTLHLLLTFLVHEPDCPRGYLGPGGLHDHGIYSNCTGGAAGYIDRMFVGASHLYQHPGPKPIYKTNLPYDPEGLLGCFTSIFLVFLGLQAGKIILIHKEPSARLVRFGLWALLTGSIAGILCCFTKNDGWIPVNKNLWSVSFIFATSCLAFILLSICFFVIDVKNIWRGAPFYQAGMNSIMLYVGHSITHGMFPWHWQVPATHMNELFMDLWGTTLWVIIAIWMHHKNVFITV